LIPVLLAATLFLQHRSVWLATIVGVLMSLLLARTQRAPLWQQFALLLLVGVAVMGSLQFGGFAADQVEASAAHAIAGEGTVSARFSNWRASIEKWAGEGPRAIAMGSELGADPTRTVENEDGTKLRIKFFAHNQYVTTLTDFGIIGLAATLWIYGHVLSGLWRLCRRAEEDAALSAVLLVLVAMQLTFYVAYGIDFTQYLVMGVACGWLLAHARKAEPDHELRSSMALARRTLGSR
jgi:O-antigen ligase